MFRILIALVLFLLAAGVATSETMYVQMENLSAKNVTDLQRELDRQSGLKYLGYCTDLSVVQLEVDRSIHPRDSVLFLELRKLGFNSIQVKTPVSDELFKLNCNHFEPRK